MTQSLATIPARGQLSRFALANTKNNLSKAVNGRSYVIPDGETVVVGATFERNVNNAAINTADDELNLEGLKTMLPDLNVQEQALEAYAGVRATTHDRLPMIGPLPDFDRCSNVYADIRHGRQLHEYPTLPVHTGLYVVAGLGSRGIVTAPFAASLLSDYLQGGHTIKQWMPLINPARFVIRQLKRG